MHVLVTGGAGFLGQRLARAVLERGTLTGPDGPQPIDSLTLLDVVPSALPGDPRVRAVVGDIADVEVLRGVVDARTAAIFHLAAVVSGMAEADFDLGWRVNLDATRRVLDVCRERGHRPRLVFTSSVAVFGGDLPAVVPESLALTPQSSYGAQKAAADLLVADWTRKGFVDGRSLRLPTITVRPGRPNAAASSFASGIIREPLNGEEAVCPVPAGIRMWVLSPPKAIAGLIAAHELDSAALGWQRSLNLPGLSVSVGDMAAALERVAGPEVAGRIRWEPDPRIERMVRGWAGACDDARARRLGLQADDSFDDIVRAHIAEQAPGRV
jgi:nucleoside-diphosphate-sugar epimerase